MKVGFIGLGNMGAPMDIILLACEKFEKARNNFGGSAAELLVCKQIEEDSKTNLRVKRDWKKHWEV